MFEGLCDIRIHQICIYLTCVIEEKITKNIINLLQLYQLNCKSFNLINLFDMSSLR